MKKRMLSFMLLITTSVFCITGCSKKEDKCTGSEKTMEGGESSDFSSLGSSTSDSTSSAEVEMPAYEETVRIDDSAKASETEKAPVDSELGDTLLPTEPEYTPDPTAGLLTAGEWNDNDNWSFFQNLIFKQQLSVPSFGMNPTNRIKVTVLNKEEQPVKDAKVELLNSSEDVIWSAVSNYNGDAYIFFNVMNNDQVPSSILINNNGITSSIPIEKADGQDGQHPNDQSKDPMYHDVTAIVEDTSNPKALDLMFVFDTTGSMGDELSYLQAEFQDIAQWITGQNTRYSVNFYRDEGDEYVVKSNEFTYDTDKIVSTLNSQSADGGDDYPEAVDQALYDAVYNHNWNAESVKLLFIILDAPPHSDNDKVNSNLQEAITEAAKQGIRIIPVASSGVDKETETFLRTAAILTGGTYTFLTDDSGIGNSHLEPTIGDYKVEALNDCIVRIINTYCK